MKQNTPVVCLQISTAQGPAECRIFARFVLGKLLAEAQANPKRMFVGTAFKEK